MRLHSVMHILALLLWLPCMIAASVSHVPLTLGFAALAIFAHVVAIVLDPLDGGPG